MKLKTKYVMIGHLGIVITILAMSLIASDTTNYFAIISVAIGIASIQFPLALLHRMAKDE